MYYLVVKSLHLIFAITWFAGLFYIVRLFIYITETQYKPEAERKVLFPQLMLMASRLWYVISWPSAVLTPIFGTLMIIENPVLLKQPWLHAKLFFIALLLIYQVINHKVFLNLKKEKFSMTSKKLRLWNEVATLFLFSIVFLAVTRNLETWGYAMAGITSFLLLSFLIIFWIKKRRKND